MPPAQKAEAKAAPQLNHTNGSDQRSKNSTNTSTNGNKHNGNSTSSSYHAQRQNQSNRRMGQQTVATLPAGVAPRTAAAPSSNHGYPYNQSHSAIPGPPQQPTPLFQRLVTEEVQELKAYARIIENQNRRLVELEKIHGDLENRLEVEARERAHLETTLERRERSWTKKYHELETDRDQWMSVVSQEKAKNDRLYDQVVRKDQDIHRMLQRKVSYTNNYREALEGLSHNLCVRSILSYFHLYLKN